MAKIDSVAIAKLAGVSRSTVSKVMNQYPNISAQTRDRILRVAKEQGYSPNLSARILAGKTTETLGFFFFGRDRFSRDLLVNLMIATVIEAAASAGFHILTYIVSDSENASSAAMVKDVFHQRRIDAGIILGAKNHEPLVEELVAEGYILGVFDQSLAGHEEPNRVVANLDDEATARKAVGYLADLGHRKVGILNGDLGRAAGAAKSRGFLSVVAERGLECRPEWRLAADFSEDEGYRAVRHFLAGGQPLPTAFAAVNDEVAFGALLAFADRGIRVPEDVSLIGIDDHPLSSFVKPGLTTFAYDFHEVFRDLIQRVVATLSGEGGVPRLRSFPSMLKIRHSCFEIGES
jgi:LacI family transcriptional regulator